MPGDATRARTAGRARWCGPARLVVLYAVLVSSAVACGDHDEGRTLRAPTAEQTTTTTAAAPASADPGAGAAAGSGGAAGTTPPTGEPLRLSSSAVADGGELPARYTCRGDDDVSPPLLWTSVPAGTVELALVVRDVDAEGFVHWVVAGLAPDLGGLAEGTVPAGAVQAANDFGRPGWDGPCPPAGTHHYEVRVYALSQASGVVQDEAGEGAAARVEAAPALASAVLSTTVAAG